MVSNLFTSDGIYFLLRWLHFFFGVMWIGHLYYFNFTQGSAMAEADGGTKSGITRILLPKALYWFRWGAMWTMVTGVAMLAMKGHQGGWEIFASSWGVAILIGSVLGLTMWANVWFVIWPKQKIVIANAVQVAGGGAAMPEAAKAAPGALLASRTNTMMSIPMLFFMGAASHLPMMITPETNFMAVSAVLLVLWLILEGNALKGKLGPMQTVKGVITSGFILTGIIYAVLAALL
jgi:uncharacterized membrane protein